MRIALIAPVLTLVLSGIALAYATDAEADAALATFKKEYATKDEGLRAKAVQTLGGTQHKKIVDALAGVLQKDSTETVRTFAARALGGQWSPTAVDVLGRALKPGDPQAEKLNQAVLAALASTDSDAAVPHLTSFLKASKTDPSCSSSALSALGAIGSPKAIDDIIEVLGETKNKVIVPAAQAALASITGQQLKTADEYKTWWGVNKGKKKTVQVFRCEGTGRVFEKTEKDAKCPHDGDKNPKCGIALKTKLEAK
ncbi:HEAT repeat domain-containing protein [bacterium]|nr:HEAT repeat domain-containing protein [bacterium]